MVQTPEPPEPPAFSAGSHMAHFHSTRFGIAVPLPDGKHWRIDDHRSALLHATHAATQSKVELVVWREDDLMNRDKCETRAREKGYGERAGEEVDTEVTAVPKDWDTRVWLGAEPESAGQAGATGHLFAFASNVRRCLYFHFETRAPLDVVSDRLAFVRLRVLGGLALDSFDIPRERVDVRGALPR